MRRPLYFLINQNAILFDHVIKIHHLSDCKHLQPFVIGYFLSLAKKEILSWNEPALNAAKPL